MASDRWSTVQPDTIVRTVCPASGVDTWCGCEDVWVEECGDGYLDSDCRGTAERTYVAVDALPGELKPSPLSKRPAPPSYVKGWNAAVRRMTTVAKSRNEVSS